jgi:membrane protein
MRYRKLFDMIRSAVQAWIEDRGPSRGAALAFYTLFSISPILIIMTSVAGYFLGYGTVRSAVIEQTRMMVGETGVRAVESILLNKWNAASNFFAGAIGLTAMLIGSTTVFIELKNTLEQIWGVEGKNNGGIWNFIRARLLALAITLAMTILIMVSIAFSAIVQEIASFGGDSIPHNALMLETLNFLFLYVLSTVLFATIYKVLPGATIEWKDVWIGASITSVLFTIGKTLTGFYLLHSVTASVFGAAGSFVVLLLWVYYSAQVFLLGAEFTKLYAQYFGSRCPHDTSGQKPLESGQR